MGEGLRGQRDFLPVLRNRASLQRGHLVGEVGLSVGLVLAGGAAHCGSTGGGRGRGRSGRSAGRVAQSGGGGGAVAGGGSGGAAGGRCNSLLLFGLLTGELGHAEDELEAAQLDVAAVVEEGSALPARPAAADQAGAACLAAAGRVGSASARLTAHHPAGQRKSGSAAGAVILALLAATCGGQTSVRGHSVR